MRFRSALGCAVAVLATSAGVAVAAPESIFDGGAEASEPAERIVMRDGPIFPIATNPRCELVNGFGGYSKAKGGSGHQGIDIGANEGQEIYAVESGLLYRQFDGSSAGLGWGLLTADDVKYRYYHLSALADGLEVGDWVEQGDVIGYVGDTGNASPGGWHLHFEVRPGPSYRPVNPYPLLDIPSECRDYIGR